MSVCGGRCLSECLWACMVSESERQMCTVQKEMFFPLSCSLNTLAKCGQCL